MSFKGKLFLLVTFRDIHKKLRQEFTIKMLSHLRKFDTFEAFYEIPNALLSTGIIIFNIERILFELFAF